MLTATLHPQRDYQSKQNRHTFGVEHVECSDVRAPDLEPLMGLHLPMIDMRKQSSITLDTPDVRPRR